MVLYADILFLINFSMDFLSMFFCAKILHKHVNKIRILLSSLIGAAYATLQVILGLSTALTIILGILFALIMLFVAFNEKRVKQIFITLSMYFFVSATLGGVMSILYGLFNSLLKRVVTEYATLEQYKGARSFVIIALTSIISVILIRIFLSKKDVKSVELIVKYKGKDYRLNGLCDSGNLLTEPFSGRKVILISEDSALGKEIVSLGDIYKKYIPYKDVSGDGMLKGIVPSQIIIEENSVDAVVATVKNKKFNGYDALVPNALI